MIKLLAILIIAELALVEIYCAAWLIGYINRRSYRKSEAQRNYYRRRAYASVRKRSELAKNRQNVWEWLEK